MHKKIQRHTVARFQGNAEIQGMLTENSWRDNETQDKGRFRKRGLTAVEHPIEALI